MLFWSFIVLVMSKLNGRRKKYIHATPAETVSDVTAASFSLLTCFGGEADITDAVLHTGPASVVTLD